MFSVVCMSVCLCSYQVSLSDPCLALFKLVHRTPSPSPGSLPSPYRDPLQEQSESGRLACLLVVKYNGACQTTTCTEVRLNLGSIPKIRSTVCPSFDSFFPIVCLQTVTNTMSSFRDFEPGLSSRLWPL